MSEVIDWGKEFGTQKKDLTILASMVPDLPTENVLSGSTAFCADTSEVYVFEASSKTWHHQ